MMDTRSASFSSPSQVTPKRHDAVFEWVSIIEVYCWIIHVFCLTKQNQNCFTANDHFVSLSQSLNFVFPVCFSCAVSCVSGYWRAAAKRSRVRAPRGPVPLGQREPERIRAHRQLQGFPHGGTRSKHRAGWGGGGESQGEQPAPKTTWCSNVYTSGVCPPTDNSVACWVLEHKMFPSFSFLHSKKWIVGFI